MPFFTAQSSAAAGQVARAAELGATPGTYRQALLERRNADAGVTVAMAEHGRAYRTLVGAIEALEHARGPEAQERAMDDVLGADAELAYWFAQIADDEV